MIILLSGVPGAGKTLNLIKNISCLHCNRGAMSGLILKGLKTTSCYLFGC